MRAKGRIGHTMADKVPLIQENQDPVVRGTPGMSRMTQNRRVTMLLWIRSTCRIP